MKSYGLRRGTRWTSARRGSYRTLSSVVMVVPQSGARIRFLLGSNVNTTFFRVFTPEFGAVPVSGYKVSPVLESLEYQ